MTNKLQITIFFRSVLHTYERDFQNHLIRPLKNVLLLGMNYTISLVSNVFQITKTMNNWLNEKADSENIFWEIIKWQLPKRRKLIWWRSFGILFGIKNYTAEIPFGDELCYYVLSIEMTTWTLFLSHELM